MFVGDPKNKEQDSFMAVEINGNKKVQFVGRFNGEDVTIVNSFDITNNKWYKVELQREFNRITLIVYEVKNDGSPDQSTKVQSFQ